MTKKIDELKKEYMGKVGKPMVLEVEKGAIKKYADATDDLNPLYWNEEYAKKTRYSSIIAPPGFFGWPVKPSRPMPLFVDVMEELIKSFEDAGFSRIVDGGIEYDFNIYVRAGDILVAIPKVADVYAREGKRGKLLFGIIETTYINQNGDIVATSRYTLIGS